MKRFPLVVAACCLLLCGAKAQELKLKTKVVVQKVLPGSIAFSPDGRYLAFNGMTGDFDVNEQALAGGRLNVNISNTQHVILLLEASSGKVKRQLLKGPEKGMGIMMGSGDPVSFSPDGRLLLAVYDSLIHVWEVEKGKKVGTWGRDLSRVVFSLDRTFALAKHSDGTFETYDLKDGHSLGTFPAHQDDSSLVPFHPEQPSIVFAKEKNLILKNLRTGTETSLGPVSGTRIFHTAISPDGKLLAVATDTYALALWSLPDNRKIFERLPEGNAGGGDPIFSPDASILLYSWKGKLTLRSLATERETSIDPQHPFGLGEMVFADAHTLATRGDLLDAVVRLWNFSPSASAVGSAPLVPDSAPSPPVKGQGEGFSFTVDRSGNVVAASAPTATSGPPSATREGSWKRWSTRDVKWHRVPLQGMSPGPALKPGNVYLDVALTLENIASQKAEFKYPHPGLFLRHRGTGQRIDPRDLTNEALRKELESMRQKGMLQNLAKDFVFTVNFEIDPGKKEEFSILFEVPQNVALNDFELHLPDAAPVPLIR